MNEGIDGRGQPMKGGLASYLIESCFIKIVEKRNLFLIEKKNFRIISREMSFCRITLFWVVEISKKFAGYFLSFLTKFACFGQ